MLIRSQRCFQQCPFVGEFAKIQRCENDILISGEFSD
jgi:hypothetical protein